MIGTPGHSRCLLHRLPGWGCGPLRLSRLAGDQRDGAGRRGAGEGLKM